MTHKGQIYYPECPEAFVVGLARSGDRAAFEDLVRRRQHSIRTLMRRCCRNAVLADDLAQQVFMQVWVKLHNLKKAKAFGAWIKRLAVTTWLQHQRKNDALNDAENFDAETRILATSDASGLAMDLDRALAVLTAQQRICVVLSYEEGMSHAEIAQVLDLPLGTTKSHIQRGTKTLRRLLSEYDSTAKPEDLT